MELLQAHYLLYLLCVCRLSFNASIAENYAAFSILRFSGAAIDSLYRDFKSLQPKLDYQGVNDIKLKKLISIDNVCYKYPKSSKKALKNIKMNMFACITVGIVGATGSGKTTTVDIVLGLLKAEKGALKVDGEIIKSSNLKS